MKPTPMCLIFLLVVLFGQAGMAQATDPVDRSGVISKRDASAHVLTSGEIDSSKVEVGAYVEVTYHKGEKLETVRGYIKAVDTETLTIGRGLWKEQIAFERIQKLIAKADAAQYTGKTSRVGREVIFYSFESLFGYLGGYLGGYSGLIGEIIITRDIFYGGSSGFIIGSMLGVASGVYWFDSKKRSKSFVGALSGSVVAGSLYLVVTRDRRISEKEIHWIVPIHVLGSIIGEWGGRKLGIRGSRNKDDDRKQAIAVSPLFIHKNTGSIFGIAFNF